MRAAVQALVVILPILYLASSLLYGMEFSGPRAPDVKRLRIWTLGNLIAAHVGYGILLGRDLGHLPLTTPWFLVSFLALAITLFWILLERVAGTPTPGAFILGAAFLMQAMASALAPLHWEPSANAGSRFFAVHALSALLAVAALLLSGLFSVLYLLLLRQLRRRTFGVLFEKLPDLEKLSRLNRAAAGLGFILLTVGVNLGIWWAHDAGIQGFSYLDPKVLPPLVLWLVFGVIGASGFVRFLSGRRAAWIAVCSSGLFVLSLLVSLLPNGTFHLFR